jgi:hypothetical protein
MEEKEKICMNCKFHIPTKGIGRLCKAILSMFYMQPTEPRDTCDNYVDRHKTKKY